MARRSTIIDPEKPPLCTIHRPSKTTAAIVSSLAVQAAHAAGCIPGGPASGLTYTLAAAGVLAMDCIKRGG
ncbi:hypothetical protein [Streptomyces sp. NPDC086182]|uniref:hypothetical protein n=1 Tax=Streptomyces sp. NPDC086182 TaxID=3155058 RepID=UPI003443CC47